MKLYPVIVAGLFLFGAGLSGVGLDLLAMPLFVLPVAWYWAVSQERLAFGLIGTAAIAALVGSGSLPVAAAYVVMASFGVLMGVGAQREWTYGWCITAVSLGLFVLVALPMVLNWEESREHATLALQAWQSSIEQQPGSDDAKDQFAEVITWYDENWVYLGLGSIFGMILVGVTALFTAFSRVLPQDSPRPRGTFREMRTSEWLIWLTIGVAVLWVVDHQFSIPALRAISWNAAVGMAFVYWLNGLSILVYGLHVFQAPGYLRAMIMVLVVVFDLGVLLSSFGLFDTWWDFRQKLYKFAEMRRLQNGSGASGGPDND